MLYVVTGRSVVISSIHHFHLAAAAAAPLPLGILLSTPESMSAMWVRRSCTPLATRWSTSLSYRSYSAGSVIVPSTTARTEQTEPADEDRQTHGVGQCRPPPTKR